MPSRLSHDRARGRLCGRWNEDDERARRNDNLRSRSAHLRAPISVRTYGKFACMEVAHTHDDCATGSGAHSIRWVILDASVCARGQPTHRVVPSRTRKMVAALSRKGKAIPRHSADTERSSRNLSWRFWAWRKYANVNGTLTIPFPFFRSERRFQSVFSLLLIYLPSARRPSDYKSCISPELSYNSLPRSSRSFVWVQPRSSHPLQLSRITDKIRECIQVKIIAYRRDWYVWSVVNRVTPFTSTY